MTRERGAHGPILIVDDDQDVREAMNEAISDEGYLVVEASNGAEALDYLRSNGAPCLVLLDLMMPVMDGAEFLRVVRRDPRLASLAVLVLSAADRSRVDQLFGELGVQRAIGKPVHRDQLLALVQQFC